MKNIASSAISFSQLYQTHCSMNRCDVTLNSDVSVLVFSRKISPKFIYGSILLYYSYISKMIKLKGKADMENGRFLVTNFIKLFFAQF